MLVDGLCGARVHTSICTRDFLAWIKTTQTC